MQHSVFIFLLFASLLIASSVYATGVCIRGYGNTPEEAFKVGTNLLNKKAAELGKEPLAVDFQIRILAEKKKDLFTVLVYSMDKPTSCDLPSKPEVAKEKKPNCTDNICTI
ncbi:MAG: hypothetical protein D3909_18485 [Candidatus Electrothrix sp. ATG1]|nr:hypothetical protein [Candidatus Electrothrix sp. ATG1]